MKVNKKKKYLVSLTKGLNSSKIVVSGNDIEIENGNCRIINGECVIQGYAVFKEVIKMYEDDFWGSDYADKYHDDDFPTEEYRFYKTGKKLRELYLAYYKIIEFTEFPLYDNQREACVDAAKERLPKIKIRRDKLLAKREKELAKPWYKRLFSKSSGAELSFVQELLDIYEKNINPEDNSAEVK